MGGRDLRSSVEFGPTKSGWWPPSLGSKLVSEARTQPRLVFGELFLTVPDPTQDVQVYSNLQLSSLVWQLSAVAVWIMESLRAWPVAAWHLQYRSHWSHGTSFFRTWIIMDHLVYITPAPYGHEISQHITRCHNQKPTSIYFSKLPQPGRPFF